jgi:prepilin-type N-terminal cleavage/methylation domain-containing protein
MTQRRGFTLIELAIAASLLAALLATSVQMLRALSNHQRAVEHRAAALEGVQAVAEQVANLPWDQLTPEGVKHFSIPAPIEKRLSGAKLAVNVVEETAPVLSKRITIELSWTNMNGDVVAPARLIVWAFPSDSPNKSPGNDRSTAAK